MTDVDLRPMRAEEWDAWHADQGAGYVEQLVALGGFAPADAEAKAADDAASLLPDGFATPGHRFLVAEAAGRSVGAIWLGLDRSAGDVVWVYDVEIEERSRGRGLGRAVMVRAEDEARAMGAIAIELNVFAGNGLAIGLYRSLGYVVTESRPAGQNMRKDLTP